MQRFMFQMVLALAIIFAGLCSTSPALAKKPEGVGSKKDQNHKQEATSKQNKGNNDPDHGKSDEKNAPDVQRSGYFSEQNQSVIHEYYSDQFRQGRCPPGLAKKGNGCMPPGHAKKWSKGQPLPREVIYYSLPPGILVQLGTPPPMHRFVRVAQDILLIATGTGMVIDAIEDIGRQLE